MEKRGFALKTLLAIFNMQMHRRKFLFKKMSQTREGTPGRHEPPRVARQTKPPLSRNEYAQHINMCLCNTGGFF